MSGVSRNIANSQQSPPRPLSNINDIGGEELDNNPDALARELRKAEYRALLQAQVDEQKEKKRAAKQKEADEDVRLMNDYANYYRIGALKQGGGSPIRDRNGLIVAQHIPFSSQS